MSAGTSRTSPSRVLSSLATKCISTQVKQFESSFFRKIRLSTRLNVQSIGFELTAMPNTKEAPFLIVAALSYELQKLKSVTNRGFVLLETGEGIQNAKRQLEAWLEQNHARAVLSIGFAGGLSSSLQPGDVVIAREVRNSDSKPDQTLLAAALGLRLGFPVSLGVAVTSDEIVWKAEAKRELGHSL